MEFRNGLAWQELHELRVLTQILWVFLFMNFMKR